MPNGTISLVHDTGSAYTVTDDTPSNLFAFTESADDRASLPAASDRPEGWRVYLRDESRIAMRGVDGNSDPAWLNTIGTPLDIMHLVGAAAPIDGASGTGAGHAGAGSIYTRTATAIGQHLNVGTKASPTWHAFVVSVL